MSIKANIFACTNRAGHAAMLANGHRGAWQTTEPTFVDTFVKSYVTNPKGNRAWGPPSA
jgi:uncharacterized cupin superfamily protein